MEGSKSNESTPLDSFVVGEAIKQRLVFNKRHVHPPTTRKISYKQERELVSTKTWSQRSHNNNAPTAWIYAFFEYDDVCTDRRTVMSVVCSKKYFLILGSRTRPERERERAEPRKRREPTNRRCGFYFRFFYMFMKNEN
jgi:hypothetical protein